MAERPSSIPSPGSFGDRPHGTRLRYISGCKCMLCRAANSRYECGRAAARRRGEWNGIVAASRARKHIHQLSRVGVGYKSVAVAADVARTILAQIRSGKRRNIRAETERRILAVDVSARADHSTIPAKRTWRLIERLLGEGFSKAELARRLGYESPALQLSRHRVLAKNALRVEKFYRLMME